MRKHLLVIAGLCLATAAMGQNTPTISLTIVPDGTEKTLRFVTNEADQKLLIDWGDGNLVETEVIHQGIGTATEDQQAATAVVGTPVGEGHISIYGSGINFFHCAKMSVTQLDITEAPDITYLYLSNNPELTELDLSRSSKLERIIISKTGLKDVDLSACPELNAIQALGGEVETVNLSGCTKLESLTLAQCKLSAIDFSDCAALTTIKLQQNQISELQAPYSLPSEATVNVSKNCLKMSQLPPFSVKSYTYAPQAPMQVAETFEVGQTLDLSAEDNLRGVKITTKPTTYTLVDEAGTELALDTDYSVSGGIITFLTEQPEPVHLVLATEAFPNFKGNNKMVTTSFVVTGSTVAVNDLAVDGRTVVAIYDLMGHLRQAMTQGINIVRYSDGTTSKVLLR